MGKASCFLIKIDCLPCACWLQLVIVCRGVPFSLAIDWHLKLSSFFVVLVTISRIIMLSLISAFMCFPTTLAFFLLFSIGTTAVCVWNYGSTDIIDFPNVSLMRVLF